MTHQAVLEYMNIALRRFLHNHGNIATEGSPKPGQCPTLISNDFKRFFIVHSTIGSTVHTRHLSSLEHCICTTTMTNIRPDRDSNLVPRGYKPQSIRMSHWGRPSCVVLTAFLVVILLFARLLDMSNNLLQAYKRCTEVFSYGCPKKIPRSYGLLQPKLPCPHLSQGPRLRPNVDLMLGQRRRGWPNNKSTLGYS